jgi:alkanesulfonate monooxygenase SsuD/methylene tetrahydromethanopterin reductase-like flavin-dependent oxidoreductase (luciferase family)
MTLVGYTMMCEQAGPKQLVRDVTLAEEAGFDFAVISDHYFPGSTHKAIPRTRGPCSARRPRRPYSSRRKRRRCSCCPTVGSPSARART